jgi:hypothetical protein
MICPDSYGVFSLVGEQNCLKINTRVSKEMTTAAPRQYSVLPLQKFVKKQTHLSRLVYLQTANQIASQKEIAKRKKEVIRLSAFRSLAHLLI